jgi:predicted aspartyl protease
MCGELVIRSWCFEASMDGRIDDRNRMLLRVDMAGGHDSLLAVVDTGFTQELLTHRAKATELGIPQSSGSTRVVVADGRSIPVRTGSTSIIWHGQPRTVAVLILDSPLDPKGGNAPTDCLAGIGLMSDSELLVEFDRGVFLLTSSGTTA